MASVFLSLLVLGCAGPDGDTESDAVVETIGAPDLEVAQLRNKLTELATDAVAVAPAWVRHDLALSLRQLKDDDQDELALLLLDEDEPWLLDEIAFTIAHISVETLENRNFYPELITQNAELVYAREADLPYVEIVEQGEAGVDDDWSTTTSYTMQIDGELETFTVDPEVYYWFVVHPRIEDEHPWFIDGFDRCTASSLECAATPETGRIWRDFLWEGAAEDCPEDTHCPVLADFVGEAEFLWNEESGGSAEGAVREVLDFLLDNDPDHGRWFSFGASGERSIQPNRIYGLGRGNCGEWADMTSAVARTALIPNVNVTPASWDHTWNAFYAPGSDAWASEWIPWEPVNTWVNYAYSGTYSIYATRGDTAVWHQTDDYSDETFELQVRVTDADGNTVDGATVAMWSPYGDSWWYAGEGSTDADGVASFALGAGYTYLAQVLIEGETYPEAGSAFTVETEAAAGETEVFEAETDATRLTLDATDIEPEGEAAIRVLVDIEHAGSRAVALSRRFDETLSMESNAEAPTAFIVDADNLSLLNDDQPFERVVLADGVAEIPQGEWYVVVPNLEAYSTAVLGTVTVSLEPAGDVRWDDAPTLTEDYQLLAGDRLAILIEG